MIIPHTCLVRLLTVFILLFFSQADSDVCSPTSRASRTNRFSLLQASHSAVVRADHATETSDIRSFSIDSANAQPPLSKCMITRTKAFQMYLALKLELLATGQICAPSKIRNTAISATATTTTEPTTATTTTTTRHRIFSQMLVVMVDLNFPSRTRCNGEPVAIGGMTWGNLGGMLSREDCQSSCLTQPLCNVLQYREHDGECTAFSSCHKLITESGFDTFAKETASIARKDANETSRCVDDTLISRNIEITLEDCGLKCLISPTCNFLTFERNNSHCTHFQTCNETVPDERVASYAKVMDPVVHLDVLDGQEAALMLRQLSTVSLPGDNVSVAVQASVREVTKAADIALSCEAGIKSHPVWEAALPLDIIGNGISDESVAMAASGTSCVTNASLSIPIELGGVTVSIAPLYSLLGTNFSVQKCENINSMFRGLIWLECVDSMVVPDIGRCFPVPRVLHEECGLSRDQFERSCSDAVARLKELMDSLSVNMSAKCRDDD
eukprot:TRINITY_DN57568_c0_g1_i1.p1 TRINITY_DN57568_c0_g1~~TRINITY_DN57568_c0_g1_i1.p1  ORF type:complete len:499 (-),score=32.29 TRINITY_DN57568_c0_g1_i1:16-1512(-)